MMLMADTPVLMATWLTPIQLTIKKLVSIVFASKILYHRLCKWAYYTKRAA